jgi:hypothetical protein
MLTHRSQQLVNNRNGTSELVRNLVPVGRELAAGAGCETAAATGNMAIAEAGC